MASTSSTSQPKKVIVTGGASGIGLALGQHFVAKGYVVIVIDVDSRTPEEIAKLVAGDNKSATVDFHRCSVADWDELAAAFKATYEKYGAIDIVMANAGVGDPQSTVMTDEHDQPVKPNVNVVNVNLFGALYTVRLAAYYMSKNVPAQDGLKGSIFCTASMAGLFPFESAPVYSASKFGVVGFVRSTGPRFAKQGLQINALAPAVVATNLVPARLVGQLHLTPTSTIVKAVENFLAAPQMVGEIAWLHGEQITIQPYYEHTDPHEKENLDFLNGMLYPE